MNFSRLFKNIKQGHLLLLLFFVLVAGCATYYQKNLTFQQHFVKGELLEANKVLDKNKRAAKNNNRLLYFLQKGTVNQLLEDYTTSNEFFEQSYLYGEDYIKNYSKELASIITNPNAKPYTGEDHELVLLHYFKIVNYLKLNDKESAMVEARRIGIKLDQLNDRYEKKKNRYKKDAWALNLMGINYEATGDINNAFIAYRNAYDAYKEIYAEHFNTKVPLQLKKDLIRTAFLNGFDSELSEYEQLFNIKHDDIVSNKTELVLFWHNGLGPVKDEWSINFLVVRGKGGMVLFVNEELGLSFPFPLPANGKSGGGLGDLKFVRVAFPKYVERKPYYRSAEVITENKNYPVELAEDINAIAFKTHEDRMLRELGNTLLRLALKQAIELEARKQNQNIGALISAANALSEKADTRNWQTLPHSIGYCRVPINEGENELSVKLYSPYKNHNSERKIKVSAAVGETVFHFISSIESVPIGL